MHNFEGEELTQASFLVESEGLWSVHLPGRQCSAKSGKCCSRETRIVEERYL